RGESASESDGSEVLDGVGVIGDSIGIIITQFITTPGTTPRAGRSITGTPTTAGGAHAAELPPTAAGPVPTPTQGIEGTGLPTQEWARAAELPTVPAQRPGLSKETPRLREDTPHPAVRKASSRAPSVTTT